MSLVQVRLKHLQNLIKVGKIKPIVLGNPMHGITHIVIITSQCGKILLQPNLYSLVSAYISKVTIKVAVLKENLVGGQISHCAAFHPRINLNPICKLQILVDVTIDISKYG